MINIPLHKIVMGFKRFLDVGTSTDQNLKENTNSI